MTITYLKGDATCPVGNEDNLKFLIHVANCNNGWGAGFVLAISKKWKEPETKFRKLFENLPSNNWTSLLGKVQPVVVDYNLVVINMIAQKGYGKNNLQKHRTNEPDTETPLQMDALEECLKKVAKAAKEVGATIHGPRFGAGLGGGKWENIETLINKHMADIDVFIYDLPNT